MFPHIFHPLRLACAAAIVAAVPVAASAAVSARTISSTEQMLAAAGFQAVPANTPQRQADLASLPAGRVTAQSHGDGYTYVLADPHGCACLYMGDAADYQAYEQLALRQNGGHRQAYLGGAYPLNWDLWGPYDGWGWQGSTFLHGSHFAGNGGGFGGHGGGIGGQGGPGQHGGHGQR